MESKEKTRGQFLKSDLSFNLEEPHIFGIVVALVVIFISLVLFIVWQRKKHAKRGVLLMGLSDSGKTLIFSRLLHSKFVLTHTSVKENVGEYTVGRKTLKIIDIPGHERLRGKFFDEYKSGARAVVYVVDSVIIQKEIRDVAEFLYNLLSDGTIARNCSPFLILCNKQDQTMAKGSTVVKSLLEKEINVLRTTKSSQLESTNETANNNTFLGKKDKDFEFSHMLPIKVEFAESFAVSSGDSDKPASLEALEKWLQEFA